VRLAALLERFVDIEAAWHASPNALAQVLDKRSLASLISTRRSLDISRTMDAIADCGARVLTLASPGYPGLLREIPNAPYVLFVRGSVENLSRCAVAIVGTRRASEYGRLAARQMARDLGERGVTVVSGLAVGIDAEAHRASVDTDGGTVAVLGCGLDVDYPQVNRSLRRRIDELGTAVSEYPLGTQPQPGHFPARNRIVSGLSMATLVVEAGERSGALITARLALDQGRDVFAVPGSIFGSRASGSNALLAAGAGPALAADDILTTLDLGHLTREAVPMPVPSDPTEAILMRLLGVEPMHVDALCREAGIAASDTARALTLMELKGWVHHMGNMRWVATR
jgi:DNA processing protein